MPNVPLARELEALSDAFHAAMMKPPSTISGPKPTAAERPADMYAAVDTRVFVRARPVLSHETAPATTVKRMEGMRNCIFMSPEVTLSGKTSVVPTSIPVDATFTDRDSNELVYETTCRGLVPVAVEGGSAALLCYGQTGSGKTFTTAGLLRCIASELQPLLSPTSEVTVAFLEVHTDGCRDLISGEPNVMILEDKQGAVQVHNCRETKVTSAQEVAALSERAVAARSTKSTERNLSGSSRSHMAVRFVIRRTDTPWVAPGVLNVVDLAGSESASDATGHDKERINETKFINASLMTLKECIRARGQAAVTTKHVHIPFRQSKLTLLLRDSFELFVQRKTKTAVIACVSPLLRDARHTYNTLRYASLLYVSPKACTVVQSDDRDPNQWSRETALEFIVKSSNGRIRNPEAILPAGDGRALAQLPEADFVNRATQQCGLGSNAAKDAYTRVWKAVVDAKKIMRGNVQRAKVQAAAKRGEAAAIEKMAAAAERKRMAAGAPTAASPAQPDPRRGSTEIVCVEEEEAMPARAAPQPHRPLPRTRQVTALLAEEKENDKYLEDLNARMLNGYAGGRGPRRA
uniref:Kinesin-like protein n=1 Tax=Neobodo designis TaxID=312471 RepID=A0A7S1LL37_NEODS|mmetsp:Transcript_24184/g.74847  ORF Transcript_24184/g.74847 Transcript_24184/m.74847 type:complete len:577 (+) Transcript_24184:49-1779(+)|eukprot:CAMPEP_0174844054 /NCGR_PEP_ID=MMETSP1114-20130205/10882_1 /TAXON_ID=312471 /ORGANISM="Neobodo designis, Strain CCAP 1951/1" /LENGTH=576 /DNA_ID=CAMNT_0016078287 /DNA_START=49 /DNA_END=1779 /DNA_ORIENTATION=-